MKNLNDSLEHSGMQILPSSIPIDSATQTFDHIFPATIVESNPDTQIPEEILKSYDLHKEYLNAFLDNPSSAESAIRQLQMRVVTVNTTLGNVNIPVITEPLTSQIIEIVHINMQVRELSNVAKTSIDAEKALATLHAQNQIITEMANRERETKGKITKVSPLVIIEGNPFKLVGTYIRTYVAHSQIGRNNPSSGIHYAVTGNHQILNFIIDTIQTFSKGQPISSSKDLETVIKNIRNAG